MTLMVIVMNMRADADLGVLRSQRGTRSIVLVPRLEMPGRAVVALQVMGHHHQTPTMLDDVDRRVIELTENL